MKFGLIIITSYVFLVVAVDEDEKEAYNEIEAQLEDIKAMLLKVREAILKQSSLGLDMPALYQTLKNSIYQGLSKHQEVGLTLLTKVSTFIVVFWDLLIGIKR